MPSGFRVRDKVGHPSGEESKVNIIECDMETNVLNLRKERIRVVILK